jgi:hypothetical protein
MSPFASTAAPPGNVPKLAKLKNTVPRVKLRDEAALNIDARHNQVSVAIRSQRVYALRPLQWKLYDLLYAESAQANATIGKRKQDGSGKHDR